MKRPLRLQAPFFPLGQIGCLGTWLEVVLTDTNWNYTDGDDISVFFVGTSEPVNGIVHTVTTNAEVRLNGV